jgi:hypothetical protein
MAKTRRRVFISAAASDRAFVRELTARLHAAGVDAWDSTTQALPGTNVSAELGRALEQAEALVVLISPAAMQSPMVRHEIQFALGHERFQDRLIPVMVRQTLSEDIPWILRTLQWAKGGADMVADVVLKALDVPKRREARAEAR